MGSTPLNSQSGGRDRILLAMGPHQNARLLREYLAGQYELTHLSPEGGVASAFDLCILDGPALNLLAPAIQARREAEPGVFVPFLLVTPRQSVKAYLPHMWKTVDEVAITPVEKVELHARVAMLLRARRFSLELKLRNDDLEAFIHAMTHDLRAPLRSITGFAELLAEESGPGIDEQGKVRIERIQSAAQQMWALIGCLLEFSRLGRKALKLRRLELKSVVDACLNDMRDEVQRTNARVEISEPLGCVLGDASLLKIAVGNLLSNALKFMAPGVRPQVRIGTRPAAGRCRFEITDNGIGIPPGEASRIFAPFLRLHGVEDYPGVGLGLSAARKVIDMMGGEIGVRSATGGGSTFWIELNAAEAA